MTKVRRLLVIVLIPTALLTAFFAYKTYYQFQLLIDHWQYFSLPEDQQKIEIWMPVGFIERNFDVNVATEFGRPLNFHQRRKPLKRLCIRYRVNCLEILADLNTQVMEQAP